MSTNNEHMVKFQTLDGMDCHQGYCVLVRRSQTDRSSCLAEKLEIIQKFGKFSRFCDCLLLPILHELDHDESGCGRGRRKLSTCNGFDSVADALPQPGLSTPPGWR